MVADWAAAKTDGIDAVMIALTHDAVTELNQRARTHLATEGGSGRPWRRSRTRAPSTPSATRWCASATTDASASATATSPPSSAPPTDGVIIERGGDRIELPAGYLADGHLDHGYALTVHKAQGATYDVALLYGDEHLYAEAGYTALTRGRDRNHVYVLADSDVSSAEAVRARLARVSAEPAALDLAGTTVSRPGSPAR